MNFIEDIHEFIEEYGWWMVLRSFDLTSKSKYYSELSDEGIGGPIYDFNDIIIKGRRTEQVRGDSESIESRAMLVDIYKTVFYIKSPLRPKKEDVIIEIQPELKQVEKAPRKVLAVECFEILHVEPKIENGVVLSKCYCKKMTPKDDETLSEELKVKTSRIYK